MFLTVCRKHASWVSSKVKDRCESLADKTANLSLERPTQFLLKKAKKKLSKLSRVPSLLGHRKPPSSVVVPGKDKNALWKRTILMGEKCKPLDFAGVIYYDSEGRRIDGILTMQH